MYSYKLNHEIFKANKRIISPIILPPHSPPEMWLVLDYMFVKFLPE